MRKRGERKKNRFPWYDSSWLTSYLLAKAYIQEHYPRRLSEFTQAFEILRTAPDFKVKKLPDLFPATLRAEMRQIIKGLNPAQFEKHEVLQFGRVVVHDHPFFIDLQRSMVEAISNCVNEPVEPCYNFLCLYNNLGVCGMHLDAPSAKWTVDYCIEQSAQWPIHLSQVRPWPEDWATSGSNWETAVKNDPANRFEPQVLQAGHAIVFGGSSQWHYRERIEQNFKTNYCHLIFFHFIPEGTSALTKPPEWAKIFGLPELSNIVIQPVKAKPSSIGG